MGRENRILSTIREKLRSRTPEHSPAKPNEIIIVRPEDKAKKYGYDTPQRRELKSRLDSLLQEEPKKLVEKSMDLYGERMLASMVADGSTADLNSWLQDPVNHTLKGKTGESLVRTGIAVDFADQMEKNGKTEEEARKTWQEKQPILNFLSLNSALARVGYQHFGLIHEVSVKIANENGGIKNGADEAIRTLFEKDYTLPEEQRGP